MPSGVKANATRRHAITAEMNLSVLRRLDPAVTAVLCSSSQVAVYELPTSSGDDSAVGWQRCEIEGSLYIVSRASSGEDEASHRVVVVNRKSRDNFVDDITPSGMELETAQQMIMYKNAAGRVLGLWFYVAEELNVVFECMSAVADGRPPPPPPPPVGPVPAATPPALARVAAAPPPNVDGKTGRKAKQGASNPKRKAPAARAAPVSPAVARAGNGATAESSPTEQIAAGDSLARFFPNMKLTNGVCGESPPANAKRAPTISDNGAVESSGPIVVEPPAESASPTVPPISAPLNLMPPHSSMNGSHPTAPAAMPPMPPAVMPPPQFAAAPVPPTVHYHHHANAMMMNMSMLQRKDLMLSNHIQQALHASNNSLADVQQSMYHTQRAQNLQGQQMQIRQQISHLQPQLAMAQSQAMAGLHARAAPPMPQGLPPMSSPPRIAQNLPAVVTSSTETNGVSSFADKPKPQRLLSEEENAAVAGKAVTLAAGQSFAPSSVMDKSQFRGLLQRMLSDNKLFECAYAAHVTF